MSEQDNKVQNRPPQRSGGPMGGQGPMGMGMPVQKAKNFKGTLKRLIGYLRPHRTRLIIVLIFAIASTSFTIAGPKVMSKGMNKLQASYMASSMLKELAKGQRQAVEEINKNMAGAQKTAIDAIDGKMAEGQKTAVEQISKSMADAQATAVDSIYREMAIQIYNGVSAGQRTAVNGITKQMGAVQKTILAQISEQMKKMQQLPQGAAVPQMDAAALEAIQKLQQLPLIDSQKTTQAKIDTTTDFIGILQSMPASILSAGVQGQSSASIDPKSLDAVKELIGVPMLDSVKPDQRADVIRKFMNMSEKMPVGVGTSQVSSMVTDEATMDKALAKLPEITDFSSKPGTGTTKTMNREQQDAVNELLKLPMLNDIQDPKQKLDTLLKLIGSFKKMPDMSGGAAQTGATPQISVKDLDTVEELLKLPSLSEITDPAQKTATVTEMVELFSSMPDMSGGTGAGSTTQVMDPEQLKTVQQFLQLPMLETITDTNKKTEIANEMLSLFSSMPDMGSLSSADTAGANNTDGAMQDDPAKNITPENVKDIQAFLKLPMLDTLTDRDQKADVSRQIIDMGKKLQNIMQGSAVSPRSDVKYTDAQVDSVIQAIRETNGEYDFTYIGMIVLILIGMYLISSLFSLIMGLVMSGVAQNTVRDLRREVDGKLSRLPLKYFDMHPHGDILSRVTNDVDTVAGTLQQSLTQIITSVITIIGYIIMMLTISPILTLIVLATMPLYVFATTMIAKKSQKYFAAQQKELGDLSGHVEEMYSGHKIVKAFGRENDSIRTFEDINVRLASAGWRAQFVSGIMFPLMNFISNLGYVGISVVGGIWITRSILGIGDILAFIQYSRSFTMPIVQTANIANVIQSTVACAERVFEVLDEEEEIPDKEDAIVIEHPKGVVRFDHVDFRYKEDVPLIEDMNMDVRAGHTIAIVGPTGAGKTTLVNLLMRFYEINAGKITIDGVDVRDIKRSALRKMFGMVLQDTWLFNGSIKDNIAYGKEGASMDDIISAAKAAHADRFIRTLPEGYETILNEEATNISQGQKQLLTIARAILADPAILILDEATSSVDTRTEVLIQRAMTNLMRNRTSFVIAHRLSTIRDAELILVMNKGSIVEMGNHKELLTKGGFYADIYNSQFSGANLDNEAV